MQSFLEPADEQINGGESVNSKITYVYNPDNVRIEDPNEFADDLYGWQVEYNYDN